MTVRGVLLNRWTAQVVITGVLVALAVWRADLDEALEAFQRANYAWAGLALAVMSVSKIIAAARWQLYLTNVARPPILGLMGAYIVGTFVNTVLPFRAGDVAKIQIVSSRYNIPRAGLTSSVFVVEAVLDAVTLLTLLLLGLAILNVAFIPQVLIWTMVGVSIGGFTASVLVSRFFPRAAPAWVLPRLVPDLLRERAQEAWPRFLDGMVTLRDPVLLTRAMALHLIEWLMRACVLWLFGLAFALDISPVVFLVLTVTVSVGTVFPITFMNIGTYQVIVTEVLAATGVPRGEAFAYSVAAHSVSHAWVVVMGVIGLWMMQIRPRRVWVD